MRNLWALSLVSGTALLACSGEGLDSETSVRGGRSLNGRSLNGRSLNGRSLNGRSLNGVALAGATLGGVALDGLALDGSELVASREGEQLRGVELAGATLRGVLSDGGELELGITAVLAPEPGDDVFRYQVSYRSDGDSLALCGVNAVGAEVPAIALEGEWDQREGVAGGGSHVASDAFTFACVDAALGKCVQLGYAPWRSVALASHHQACTRLLRADYCGDGTSFTENGRLINLYDGLGVQVDTESWLFEAEWTTEGARCISVTRADSLADAAGGGRIGIGVLPECVRRRVARSCGSRRSFGEGVLLLNEFLLIDSARIAGGI